MASWKKIITSGSSAALNSIAVDNAVTATSFTGIFNGAISSSAQIKDDISGSFSGATAGVATTVTISDNESTNESNAIIFGAGAAGSGNIGLEADGDLTYNPSTGKVSATGFIGALTGNG